MGVNRLEASTPTVEDMCDWLSSNPRLDDVAETIRRLRFIHREMDQAIELLRSHMLIAMGEGVSSARGSSVHEEPF